MTKLATYHLKCMNLRPFTYEFTVETDAIICQRGDLIWISSDVALAGQTWGRITRVDLNDDGDCEAIDVDEPFEMTGDNFYTTRIRNKYNTYISQHVVTNDGFQTHLVFDPPAPADYGLDDPPHPDFGLPGVGDLIQFGYSIGDQLIVTGIEPQPNLTHKITCQDYAVDVYS